MIINNSLLDSVLKKVEKPARYTGGELNMREKSTALPIRFLFAFPDVYEVGMSHLGTSILYDLLNKREDTYAERVFAPFPDMQKEMTEKGISLFSLETKSEARDFDIIGFNLSYEMCYTTVLKMLSLSNIPLRAEKRGEEFPLIIAGGACTYNPEPIAPFIDLFVIGEGEEVTNELLDLYRTEKEAGYQKERFLNKASKIEGVYVPSLYTVSYEEDGRIKQIDGPGVVKKRYVTDFDQASFPEKPIVPYIGIVHDRVTLEIMRGCTRGCRFCQAGFVYRPVRERSKKTLLKQAETTLQNTGYEEVSLSSLSSGDYSEIAPLSIELLDRYEGRGIGVSLPSLRIDSFSDEYVKRMQGARKSSYTFAPEAGTQRLRDVINKNVTEEDLLRSVRMAFESGVTGIKLYFMIGLPTETFEDLDGIQDVARKVIRVFKETPKELRKGELRITISTSSFVPKPFTPFQWCAQDEISLLREKQEYLKQILKMKYVKYNWHDARLSFLEAVFAMGDRRLADVLEYALENGAQFDSWQDYFRNEYWEDAFLKAGITPEFYANRTRELQEALPFDHISCRVEKRYFAEEYEAAKRGECTGDCRKGCNGCGFDGGNC